MAAETRDIDELYRVSLSDFTRARNALAERSGTDGGAIRKLPKPNVPAWAVNQLYWHKRGVFDRLHAAAVKLRNVHSAMLGGKRADVPAAETVHQTALNAAVEETRQILLKAGEHDSPATLLAVRETLQAVPAANNIGRLSRPLKPLGFEALSGLLVKGAPPGRHLKAVTPAPKRPALDVNPRHDAAEARRVQRARDSELAAVRTRLRASREAEQNAAKAVTSAKRGLEQIRTREASLRSQLDELVEARDKGAREVETASARATVATREREALEDRLKFLESSRS